MEPRTRSITCEQLTRAYTELILTAPNDRIWGQEAVSTFQFLLRAHQASQTGVPQIVVKPLTTATGLSGLLWDWRNTQVSDVWQVPRRCPPLPLLNQVLKSYPEKDFWDPTNLIQYSTPPWERQARNRWLP